MMVVAAAAGAYALEWLLDLLGGHGGSWVSGVLLLYLSWLVAFLVTRRGSASPPPNSA